MVAVCQPCVPALVATAVMAPTGTRPCRSSLTLMAGPIDARINPTEVNELATIAPDRVVRAQLIADGPGPLPGCRRRVYPGFLQLGGLHEHEPRAPRRVALASSSPTWSLATSSGPRATRSFYDEYFAVLDLPPSSTWRPCRRCSRSTLLPRRHARISTAELVDPAAIRRTALLTVEGERDDICAVGQTLAAHDLCTGDRRFRARHHLQPGVGHYGVFSGRRWEQQIYPIVRNFIRAND